MPNFIEMVSFTTEWYVFNADMQSEAALGILGWEIHTILIYRCWSLTFLSTVGVIRACVYSPGKESYF